MKSRFLAVLASVFVGALMIWAVIPGTTPLGNEIAPTATNSNYGVTLPVYGVGGLLTGLDGLPDLNIYPLARRHAGMLIIPTNGTTWQLQSDLTTLVNVTPIYTNAGVGYNVQLLGTTSMEIVNSDQITSDAFITGYDGVIAPNNYAMPKGWITARSTAIECYLTNILALTVLPTVESGGDTNGIPRDALVLEGDWAGIWRYDPFSLSDTNGANIRYPNDITTNTTQGRWQFVTSSKTTKTVQTISELLSTDPRELASEYVGTNTSFNALVNVSGYYDPGDRGGGLYFITNSITDTNALGGKIVALGGTMSWMLAHDGSISSAQFGIVPSTNSATMGQRLTDWTDYCRRSRLISVLNNGEYWILNTNGWILSDNAYIVGEPGATIARNYSDPALQNPRYSPIRVTNSAIPFGGNVPIYATNITVKGLSAYTVGATTGGTNVGNNMAFIGVSGLTLEDIYLGTTTDGWALIPASDNVLASNIRIRNGGALFRDGIHWIGGTNNVFQNLDIQAGDDAIAFGSAGAVIDRIVVNGAILDSTHSHAIKFTQETEANTNVFSNIIVTDVVHKSSQTRLNGSISFQSISTNLPIAWRNIKIANVYGDYGFDTTFTAATDKGIFVSYGENITLENVDSGLANRHPIYITDCVDVYLVRCKATGTVNTNLQQTIYAINTDRVFIEGGVYKSNPTNTGSVTARFESVDYVNIVGAYFENLSGSQIIQTSTDSGTFQLADSVLYSTGTALAFSVNPTNVIITGNMITSGSPSATWQGGVPPATSQIANNIGLESIGTLKALEFQTVTASGVYVSSVDSPSNNRMRLTSTNSVFQFAKHSGSVTNNVSLQLWGQARDQVNAAPVLINQIDNGSFPTASFGSSAAGAGLRAWDIYTAASDYGTGVFRYRFGDGGLRVQPSGVSANASADNAFQVESTTKGSRPAPTQTTAQRLAIVPVTVGALLVWDSDFQTFFQLRAGTTNSWRAMSRLVLPDQGDASVTLNPWQSGFTAPFSSTLTANRTVTLGTTGALNGDLIKIVRTGLGAFTLDVGGLKIIPSATAATVEVQYNGSAWSLVGYQLL